MKNRALFFLVCIVLGCAFLTGCTASVRLGGERFPVDSETVTAVLSSGDMEKLEKLSALKSADFSGSSCYDEMFFWAQAHPEVSVSYTVAFPDGTVVGSGDTTADLSALTAEDATVASELFTYLPQLTDVALGQVGQREFLLLAEAWPDITFDYPVSIAGKTVSTGDTHIDLTGITHSDIDGFLVVLPYMSALERVELGDEDSSQLSWTDIAALQAAAEGVDFNYAFTLFGKSFTTLDTEMDLNHITMDDEGAAVREVLPCMTKLTYLDMDFCGVSNEAMASIREDYPAVDVVWRIWFGSAGVYSVRTDVIKILASKPSVGGNLDSEDVAVLKYCTKVKYLDLGHNGDGASTGISDISFVSYMPDLEVAILAMNNITDISPLADCPKLEYLEIFSTPVSDLSPLANSTQLRHLRIEYMPNLTDISPLYGLTQLERLWLNWNTPVPQEQIDKMRECAPNCEINTEGSNRWTIIGLNEVSWVYTLHPRYKLLREQFGYDTLDYSFSWLDPKY